MLRYLLRFLWKLTQAAIAAGLLVLLLPRLIVLYYGRARLYSPVSVPAKPVAIVFGAGLWRDGTPTPILRDRVATAAELYFQGKVKILLLSGDNRFVNYNEPEAMRQYALSLGVPEEALALDHAGRRTYDTCYRAKVIFGVTEAILVTQGFHLPRALYLCNHLGIEGVGVPADRQYYRKLSRLFWNLRELPATLSALIEVHLTHPRPTLGRPQPLFPS